MAEDGGLIEGVLGGGAETPEPPAPGGLDPIAAALATSATVAGETLDPQLKSYLARQEKLVEIQTEHLHEQRIVVLANLKLKRASERLKLATQGFVAVVALVIVCGLGLMVWNAAHDHGLVVEPFSVAPAMAQRGLTGEVVARQMLGRLADMQAHTGSLRAANTYQNNWGDDLKVEIPETGVVSITEAQRFLRNWLGRQTRISGEVYQTPSGLTVTARAGETAGDSFSGADTDYDALLQRAAEAVYGTTQPYRFAIYLQQHDREDDANKVLLLLAQNHDAIERAWAYHGLAGHYPPHDLRRELALYRRALDQVPDFAPALGNMAFTDYRLGRYQASFSAATKYLADRKAIEKYISADRRENSIFAKRQQLDFLTGNYRDALKLTHGRATDGLDDYKLTFAVLNAESHDFSDTDALVADAAQDDPERSFVLGLRGLEAGDPQSIAWFVRSDEDQEKARGRDARLAWEWMTARAKARFGDAAGAQALIGETALDCYPCVATRGVVAAARGDKAAAEHWFAEAIRMGPDIPFAYVDRGQARLDRGDAAGALADAEAASRVGPHFADALKLWGDALAKTGAWSEAVVKYDAALAETPAWKALKQARAAAASHAR
jgi:tetratricopeptide (TPR) repeat protein